MKRLALALALAAFSLPAFAAEWQAKVFKGPKYSNYLSISDDWGRRKLALMRERGLRTHVLWEVPPEEKGLTATEVRACMAAGRPWAG